MTECFICGVECRFYFRKEFDEYGLTQVDYYRCPQCGFVLSKTHHEMEKGVWEKLNLDFQQHENPTAIALSGQPPYLQQAMMLNVLAKNRLVSLTDCLDWGSGYGTLRDALRKYFSTSIKVFDRYMHSGDGHVTEDELARTSFKTVINSAVFEHVTNRCSLDEIHARVAPGGCLAIHTVVCEVVPQDPGWFYFLPVHCAFHTNRSMELLMEQWGYAASVYSPLAKMWVLFKSPPARLASTVDLINVELQMEYLHYKEGFVDYWK